MKHQKEVSTATQTDVSDYESIVPTNMLQTVIKLLSEMNAKIDAIAAMQHKQTDNTSNVDLQDNSDSTPVKITRKSSPTENKDKHDTIATMAHKPARSASSKERREVPSFNLTPVKSLIELQALENNANEESFVRTTIASIGQMHGKGRYINEGKTVCLQIIDRFFDRKFLLQCSWTGTSRGEGEHKVPFMQFEKTINLFFRTVLYSDPEFTLQDCKSFLHRCLRNATQRSNELGKRKAVARKRKRRNRAEPSKTIPMFSNIDFNRLPDYKDEDENSEEALNSSLNFKIEVFENEISDDEMNVSMIVPDAGGET
ncbi:uncharacterized protein LOC128743652 [Sabethes cyaneus]|uniref:uncharacterized protein LOC128743652 n=1 Tax=Sabethes cyaneus TaxID=53552 RepID=UPI00237E65E6|nr:uncharacterized protein LOC128743652 [Sabethes cyaneus]